MIKSTEKRFCKLGLTVFAASLMMISTVMVPVLAENNTEEDNTLLKEIETANDLDALSDKYGRFSYTLTSTYYEDLEPVSETVDTVYIDNKRYVQENEDMLIIDEDGEIYGTSGGTPTHYLLAGESYDDFVSSEELRNFYAYSEDEMVLSKEEKDGIIYLSTEDCYDGVADELELYGIIQAGDMFKQIDYTIDADSKEILTMECSAVTEGNKYVFLSMIADKDCEEYTVDEKITEGVYADDLRTVTVIADPGTDDEKSYSQTVGKGNYVVVFSGFDFENTLYEDPECTVEFTGSDSSEDLTVYIKHLEE